MVIKKEKRKGGKKNNALFFFADRTNDEVPLTMERHVNHVDNSKNDKTCMEEKPDKFNLFLFCVQIFLWTQECKLKGWRGLEVQRMVIYNFF